MNRNGGKAQFSPLPFHLRNEGAMKRKILLVEDEEDVLYLAKIRLEEAGFEVLSANNTKDAQEIIFNQNPDVILLDLLLPGEQGEEFCKRLKSDEKLKDIPVILFTAMAHDAAGKMKESGADDYISKPFNPRLLLKKIDRLLK